MAKKQGGKAKQQGAATINHRKVYKALNLVEKNKIAKIERHLKRNPEDKKANNSLNAIKSNGYKAKNRRPNIRGKTKALSAINVMKVKLKDLYEIPALLSSEQLQDNKGKWFRII